MRRPLVLGVIVACIVPACQPPVVCSLSFVQGVAQNVAPHIAPTIPLNTQADCAGASRVPFNEQSVTSTGEGTCTADPTDSACVACLRGSCCTAIADACQGGEGTIDPANCAAEPGVKTCILTALDDKCIAACGGAS